MLPTPVLATAGVSLTTVNGRVGAMSVASRQEGAYPVEEQRFLDLAADRVERIQGEARVLKHEAYAGTAHTVPLAVVKGQEIGSAEIEALG